MQKLDPNTMEDIDLNEPDSMSALPRGPIKFQPPEIERKIRSMEVSTIWAEHYNYTSPHPITGNTTTTPHWSIVLASDEFGASDCRLCRVQCIPSSIPGPLNVSQRPNAGSKAQIVVTANHENYTAPDAIITTRKVTIQQGITVGWILDKLVQAGRHRYQFGKDEVGNPYWISDTLAWLASIELKDVDISGVGKDVRTGTPLCMEKGAGYYDDEG